MKLDCNILRYLTSDDWRVLVAIEVGQRNHELVPTTLITSLAGLKFGGQFKALSQLLRHKLVHHENKMYDAYRLTYMGYDFLSLHHFVAQGWISSVGRQIGVGKESDIFEVANEEGEIMALKLHRLGRTSFRDVKSKRDYLKRGHHYSWLYLSKIAATKEFAFMKALGERGLPVPTPFHQNRHGVLMQLVDARPLVQLHSLKEPGAVYARMMELMSRMVKLGLVHCDYNEFNVLVDEREALTIIDFPQMVSIAHANARELFERDVQCVMRFFRKKMDFWMDDGDRPTWEDVIGEADVGAALDKELYASGFKNEDEKALNAAIQERRRQCGAEGSDSDEDEGDAGARGESDGEGRGADSVCGRAGTEGAFEEAVSAAQVDIARAEVAAACEEFERRGEGAAQGKGVPGGLDDGVAGLTLSDVDGARPASQPADGACLRSTGSTCSDDADEGGVPDTVSVAASTVADEERRAIQARVQAQRKIAASNARKKLSRNTIKLKGKRRKEHTSIWE